MQELLSKSNDIEIPKHNEDSRVEYLGMTPVNWLTTKLKFVYNIQLGKMLQNEPQNETDSKIPYFKAMHVQWENVEHTNLPKMWASLSDQETYTVKNGDLLVCEGGEVGRAAVITGLQEKAIIQNALHRVRPTQKSDIKYLMYLLRHIDFLEWFDVLCNKATIAHLTSEKLGNLIIPLPSKSEQQAIADFLDRETGKLDRLVEKKKRLIELLREKRQALITQAVTKGLDPDVPMKDSGIEWLGEVPAHWDVVKLGLVLDYLSYGFTNPMPTSETGPYMLTANDIGDGKVIYNTARKTTERAYKNDLTKKAKPCKNDILVTKDGTLGRVALYDGDHQVCINQSVALLRPGRHLLSKYLLYLLTAHTFQYKMKLDAGGSTIKHIYISRLAKMHITLPPKEEQVELICFIDENQKKYTELISKLQTQITKIKEYRQALISAAVTGKIDVREKVQA